MGGTQNSFSPQARIPQARDGYTPVNMVQKNGQYYNYTPAPLTHPMMAKMHPEARPQGTYTPINFGGSQQSANRYGPPRKYGTPSSSYRAPATYRNTPAPAYGGGYVGKGGVSAPPPSYGGYGGGMSAPIYSHPLDNPMHGKLAKANKSGSGAALGRYLPSKPKVPYNNIF
jgi:hypothetical protein